MLVAEVSLFDRIVHLISARNDVETVMKLHATETEERRYRELSLKFQGGGISEDERKELYEFETIIHLVRMAKIKSYAAQLEEE